MAVKHFSSGRDGSFIYLGKMLTLGWSRIPLPKFSVLREYLIPTEAAGGLADPADSEAGIRVGGVASVVDGSSVMGSAGEEGSGAALVWPFDCD